MAAVTTSYGPKPFTWSYSRLKNFEVCPKKHYEVDIKKSIKEGESDNLIWGNEVHDKMAKRVGDKRIILPDSMKAYEPHALRIVTGEGNIHVENKMAITKEFAACGFFDRNVWFRSIVDVIKINNRVAGIWDWKTGKIVEDSCQLALSAACVFAKFPEVKKIRSSFVWLKDNAVTNEDFTPEDMPGQMLRALEQAKIRQPTWPNRAGSAARGALFTPACTTVAHERYII